MKSKIIISLTILFLLPISNSNAQISKGGMPPSFTFKVKKSAAIPQTTLPKIKNIETLLEEDAANPIPFRYSILQEVTIDIKNKGELSLDEPGNRIWQYHIISEGAFSLGLVFEKFNLPEGAKLFVYSPDRKNILGAFTNQNNKKNGKLHLQELEGKEAIIEYFEPKEVEFEGELILGGIGQAYKNLFEDLPDTAYIGINCPIGDNWQLEKHAVVKYTSVQGSSIVSCTGFLVNNTNEDGAPYMLTANHCIHTDSDAENLVAYFNFEKEDCQSTISLTPRTISEATMLATNSSYDFALVELSQSPPASYQPYYAGWSLNENARVNSTSIHHPEGTEKSISIDYDSIETYPSIIKLQDGDRILTIPANSTWVVSFDRGKSYKGSSGSPLFNSNKRVIGLLSAGNDTYNIDFYIKLNKAFSPKDSEINEQLKHWLDPAGQNPEFIDGYIPFPNATPPDAHFFAEYRGICQGSEIQLTDNTTFGANLWQWEFSPNSVTFIEGNNSSQNPVVKFNEIGEYTVTLTAQNDAGSSIRTRNNYISTEDLNIKIRRLTSYSSCILNFQGVKIMATGAETYHWFVEEPASDYLDLQGVDNDTLIVKLKTEINPNISTYNIPDSIFPSKIYLEGTIDSCSSIIEYDLNLLFHNNDDIANAFPLLIDSLQGPFRNSCASIEENEPIPPIGDCTKQGEWCGCNQSDEYEFILGNSTWFTFIAPESGIVGIETLGYDNQIAVYDAESAEDILSGNPANYTIIGANDDFSDTDFSAKIPTITVTPGKKYWIQADGSACNDTGQFTIRIASEEIVEVGTNYINSQQIASVYPNPAKNLINVSKKSSSNLVYFSIYDINGKQMLSKQITGNSVQIDTKNLARGMYIIRIVDKNEIQIDKLILE